jgi:hypothetical protein
LRKRHVQDVQEALRVPPRANLGPAYHRLWTATAISTLGDGVFLTALPLLAATLSRDPLRVSLITFAGWNAPQSALRRRDRQPAIRQSTPSTSDT